jgi:3-oxoacyl-[acyl-carrier-protein] synthase II
VSELRDVVVTGTGVVSSAGETAGGLAAAMRSRRPSIGEITAFEPAEGEPRRASEIAGFDLARHVPSVKSYIDRTSTLALAAAKVALDDAGLGDESARPGEVGLAYGTQWGCLDSMELFYGKLQSGNPRFAPPLPFSHSYANSPASVLSIELKLRGDHRVYSTGRLSGAWALLGGADAVALGAADAVACCASDSLTRSAFRHYLANGRLLPDEVTDPASDEQGRFLLGEGAACLVLEAGDVARDRAAAQKAELLAVGSAAEIDAAAALDAAARDALGRGGVRASEVEFFIAADSTGPGAAGAGLEIAAAARLAGESEDLASSRFLSTGLVLGETMGASGALAAAAACVCAAEGLVLVLAAEGTGGAGLATAIAVLVGPAG